MLIGVLTAFLSSSAVGGLHGFIVALPPASCLTEGNSSLIRRAVVMAAHEARRALDPAQPRDWAQPVCQRTPRRAALRLQMFLMRSAMSDTSETTASTSADETVIAETRRWLERAVIGLNLCPFARSVHAGGGIRYRVSDAQTPEQLLEHLGEELRLMSSVAGDAVETTLLIHPQALTDFLDFNDFLDVVDAAVETLGLSEVLQVASFHPHYQFADTDADDIGNYTNRAPYPTLHLLRHDSVERAVAAVPDPAAIFETNIETLRRLGHVGWRRLMSDEGGT